MSRKSGRAPKQIVTFRINPELLEMLKQGAAYHDIPYQTYMHWLLEEGLRNEANYYGWASVPKPYTMHGPTKTQSAEIDRLVRVAARKRKD
jgi:hypothetical protein